MSVPARVMEAGRVRRVNSGSTMAWPQADMMFEQRRAPSLGPPLFFAQRPPQTPKNPQVTTQVGETSILLHLVPQFTSLKGILSLRKKEEF